MSSNSKRHKTTQQRKNSPYSEPFRQPKSERMRRELAPRAHSIQAFKERKRQTTHSVLRQKGRDVTVVLPRAWNWSHWHPGQRVWFRLRDQTVVITRKPSGQRGMQRYSSRIRNAHVSLTRARAERSNGACDTQESSRIRPKNA